MVVDQSLVCYIKDNNTGATVQFNVEKPEGYSDAYSANFMQQDVRGRSSPFQSYINSGPRSISFSILLSLDYRRSLASHTEQVRKMLKPHSSRAGVAVKAPSVHVKIGNALEIDAIPVSFNAEWEGGYKEGVYRLCTWSFSFTEVEETSTYDDSSGTYESVIPAGLNSSGASYGRSSGSSSGEIGEKVTISKKMTGYYTANEAMNNKSNGNPTATVQPGEYYVYNRKGNAVNVTTQPGKVGIGWVVI